MRRIALVVVLAGFVLGLSGCWFFDAEHNRAYWKMVKKDLMQIHEDLDFILAMDPSSESPLEMYER